MRAARHRGVEIQHSAGPDRGFGATFMGLTVGCAVCHDHKFDPTTQQDFYSLSAFFNNIDEKPFNGDRPVWSPVVRIPRAQNHDAYDRVLAKRAACSNQDERDAPHQPDLVTHGLRRRTTLRRAWPPTDLVLAFGWMRASGDVLTTALRMRTRPVPYECSARRMGRDHLAMAGFPHAVQYAGGAGSVWRLTKETRLFHLVDGSCSAPHHSMREVWHAHLENGFHAARPRVGSFSGRRIPERRASKRNVEKPHFGRTDKGINKERTAREKERTQRTFSYPSPQDLTKKDLSAYKPPEKKRAEEEAAKKDKAKAKKSRRRKGRRDTTPQVAIRVGP